MNFPDYYGVKGRKKAKSLNLKDTKKDLKYLLGKIYSITIGGENDDLTDEEMEFWERVIE